MNLEEQFKKHAEEDKNFQDEFRNFVKRCEPMIKVFEDNKIYQMEFKQKTGTIVFYGKAILTFASIGAIVWAIIKSIR